MEEKVIGLVYRYGPNDYQINLMDFDEKDQEVLMSLMERYDGGCSCERGDKFLTLDKANIEHWEVELLRRELDRKRETLAYELYQIGCVESDVLYDHQAEEQITKDQIAEELKTYKGAAYMLETFLWVCKSIDDIKETKYFDACMKIVHYMENLTEEN